MLMNILIDLIFFTVAVGVIAGLSGKNVYRVFVVAFSLCLALVLSPMITDSVIPSVQPSAEKIFVKRVAVELAEITQTSQEGSVEDILSSVDVELILNDRVAEFELIAKEYNVSVDEMREAVNNSEGNKAESLAYAVVRPFANTITYLVIFAATTLVLFLFIRFVINFILSKVLPKERLKRKRSFFSFLFSVAVTVMLISFCFVPMIEQLRPYTVGILKIAQIDYACGKSALYGLFGDINFLM